MNSLKNLIGKVGKSNGYYMELLEDESTPSSVAISQPTPQPVSTVLPEQPPAEPTKPTKVKKLKKSETPAPVAPAETTQPVVVATVASAPAKPAAPVVVGPKNFATDFLVYGTTPRRRPGPSMTAFMDMVGDMQFPNK